MFIYLFENTFHIVLIWIAKFLIIQKMPYFDFLALNKKIAYLLYVKFGHRFFLITI